jgi:hypothetical protein
MSHVLHALRWTALAGVGIGTLWAWALRRMYVRTLAEERLWDELMATTAQSAAEAGLDPAPSP